MASATKLRSEDLSATLDEGAALRKVKDIDKAIALVRKKAGDGISIEDEDDYRLACDLLISTIERRNWVREEKKAFMADVKKLVERVDGWFKPTLSRIDDLEKEIKEALAEWARQLHAKGVGYRRAAARLPARDEEKAAELQRKADACEPEKYPGVSFKRSPQIAIVDEARIPERFFVRVLDRKLLEAELERGEEIPGARLEADWTISVTPKNARKED